MVRRAKVVVMFFIGAAVVLSITIGSIVYLRSVGVHDNCEGVNEVKTALIKIMTRAEQLSLHNPDYSKLEKEAAVTFYTHGVNDLQPKSC